MEQYELIRSRRKTLALEITRDCRLLVRAPLRMSKARIDAFVSGNAAWIARHLEEQRRRAASAPPPPTTSSTSSLSTSSTQRVQI